MTTVGTWYPPSAGTGTFLCNPPFMTPPTITITRTGDLWQICYGSTCRETPDWWQVTVWLEQFSRLLAGAPEGDGG